MWPTITVLAVAAAVALHLRARRVQRRLDLRLREARDQTDRLEAASLTASRLETGRRAHLLNSLTDGILLLDGDGRVELANQALLALFGLHGDILGRPLIEALRVRPLDELVSRLQAEPVIVGFEIEIPGPPLRQVEVNASRLAPVSSGRPGALLLFRDVTRVRQLERTRQEFVANVSHELRTPLSMIKGYCETLLGGAKNDPAHSARFLQIIDKHADRLTCLIEDLLTLSSLESGRVALNLQPTNLRSLADRVLEDLAGRATSRPTRLVNGIPPELGNAVDAGRIQQVLFNLVENAIKYGRPDGTITVGARLRPDHSMEAWVQDDGAGIPPDAIPRVFERFFRVDKARSRDQGGTGLGLAIVKHIVQAHGGEVGVESTPGQGCRFFFTLPAR